MLENTKIEETAEVSNLTLESVPQMSSSINKLASALSEAQSQLESVTKGEKGYGYSYASLASTIETATKVLKPNGLSVTQLVGTTTNGLPSVTTILMHTSGQFVKSVANMPLIEMKGVNEAQRAGAVYSYLRRYALQAILNMASEDNDASSHGIKKAESTTTPSATVAPKAQKFRKPRTSLNGNSL